MAEIKRFPSRRASISSFTTAKARVGVTRAAVWEFFQVINGETSVTVPGKGNGATNPDPYGHGGISSIRGWAGPTGTVPDGGSTVMLLGAALGSLGMARRFLKK